MGIEAAGAYLRALREGRGIGRGALAKELGIDHSQIERIEKGQTDTRGSLLLAIVVKLEGDADQVATLITSKDASIEDAQQMAQTWISHQSHIQEELYTEISEISEQLQRSAYLTHQWIGYGHRLIDELRERNGGQRLVEEA